MGSEAGGVNISTHRHTVIISVHRHRRVIGHGVREQGSATCTLARVRYTKLVTEVATVVGKSQSSTGVTAAP